MQNTKIKFSRNQKSIQGFQSIQTPSTDALNVLSNWADKGRDRSFNILVDSENEIVALLKYHNSDVDVGKDIDILCNNYGVVRDNVLDNAEKNDFQDVFINYFLSTNALSSLFCLWQQ